MSGTKRYLGTPFQAPCRECSTRCFSCHSSCVKYKRWKQEREDFTNACKADRDMGGYYADFKVRLAKMKKGKI
jgi:hypothetical protein